MQKHRRTLGMRQSLQQQRTSNKNMPTPRITQIAIQLGTTGQQEDLRLRTQKTPNKSENVTMRSCVEMSCSKCLQTARREHSHTKQQQKPHTYRSGVSGRLREAKGCLAQTVDSKL